MNNNGSSITGDSALIFNPQRSGPVLRGRSKAARYTILAACATGRAGAGRLPEAENSCIIGAGDKA